MSEEKTNVMRLLEQKKVPYTPHQYPHQEGMAVDGATVAAVLGRDPASVFKTLVTRGATKANYVFVVPVLAELDLKKAARAVGEKSIEMIHVKELTPLTGYVRGGCSPIGMKKRFKTVLDQSAADQAAILVSAGKIGCQVELAPGDLVGLVGAGFADIIKE
ncbi:Cys-tRNA(Pro) deacylase [Intestinimonas sp. RTP31139st1_F5_RTP31139_211217]|uniref:Cys-tRNA(Pro) deacylase n=1 Tax=Intestinimonas sp. RTP31139st1_F5_RTP31139_211217 TaxID=3143190 RepID=UPI0032EF69CE